VKNIQQLYIETQMRCETYIHSEKFGIDYFRAQDV